MAIAFGLPRSQMIRRSMVALCIATMISAWFELAEAQQPTKIPRIGYVSGTGNAANQGPYVEALRQGLRDFGYVEGKNFTIEYRGAEGKMDRIATLVNELRWIFSSFHLYQQRE